MYRSILLSNEIYSLVRQEVSFYYEEFDLLEKYFIRLVCVTF